MPEPSRTHLEPPGPPEPPELAASWRLENIVKTEKTRAPAPKSPIGRVFAAAVRSKLLLAITLRRCRLISTELCST